MISLLISIAVLVLGYLFYGKIVERLFGVSDNLTPAVAHPDGVDYVPLKKWKSFLVQLLNIAGTGPIFGALMGAVFGPVVFLWIVFGSVLGGAVHDYLCGMISVRMDGASVSEIVGNCLGGFAKQFMRFFSVILLIGVGAVFVTSPAALISMLTPDWMNTDFWVIVILLYYTLATLLPIDKLIARIYPLFGFVLIAMAIGIAVGLIVGGYTVPEISFENLHPTGKDIFPFMFITVACGAISGFHATQSPLMARCLTSEKQGKSVFYGAMLTESVIALIWAAAGVAFYGATGGLQNALASLGQSGVVYEISKTLLGTVGSILSIVGVVICPISSGDTAFRCARLTIADWLHIEQKSIVKRLYITLPLLAVGGALTQIDFDIIWRYFSFSNQTLAAVVLWACAAYLLAKGEKRFYSLIAAFPASFMTAVCITYILMADEGFGLSALISYTAGIGAAVFSFGWFLFQMTRIQKSA